MARVGEGAPPDNRPSVLVGAGSVLREAV